jgi:hypothetical protein
MKTLLFLSLLFFAAVSVDASIWSYTGWTNCGMTRAKALVCIKKYFDRDHNGIVTQEELHFAENHYATGTLKALLWIAKQFGLTMKAMLKWCDANKDGVFTVEDFEKTAKTCLYRNRDLCIISGKFI